MDTYLGFFNVGIGQALGHINILTGIFHRCLFCPFCSILFWKVFLQQYWKFYPKSSSLKLPNIFYYLVSHVYFFILFRFFKFFVSSVNIGVWFVLLDFKCCGLSGFSCFIMSKIGKNPIYYLVTEILMK